MAKFLVSLVVSSDSELLCEVIFGRDLFRFFAGFPEATIALSSFAILIFQQRSIAINSCHLVAPWPSVAPVHMLTRGSSLSNPQKHMSHIRSACSPSLVVKWYQRVSTLCYTTVDSSGDVIM